MSDRRRAIVAFLVLTFVWGTTWAAIRFGLDGIPPLSGVAIRFLIAGAALLAVALLRGVRLGATTRERRLWVANALATFVIPYGVIYWAEIVVPTGLASILFSTFPLWIVLLGRWVVPGERVDRRRLLGVLAGFAGIAVIFSEDVAQLGGPGVRLRGAALLLAAVVSASGSLMVKRWGGGISPLSLAAVPMLLCGVVTGLLAAAVERDAVWGLAPAPVLATLYLALVGSALTFTLYFWLLARTTAVSVSMISYTAPVVAVLIGTLVLDEPFTLRLALGGALVLAGVAWALTARRESRSPAG